MFSIYAKSQLGEITLLSSVRIFKICGSFKDSSVLLCLVKGSNLTNIFRVGWNWKHQLVLVICGTQSQQGINEFALWHGTSRLEGWVKSACLGMEKAFFPLPVTTPNAAALWEDALVFDTSRGRILFWKWKVYGNSWLRSKVESNYCFLVWTERPFGFHDRTCPMYLHIDFRYLYIYT